MRIPADDLGLDFACRDCLPCLSHQRHIRSSRPNIRRDASVDPNRDNGQLSGVLSLVELNQDGNVSSEQTPVNSTADSDQLTLKFPAILSFISVRSLSGTINESTIHLRSWTPKGNVSSEEFVRSTPAQFKAYADEMKSKGQRIVYNTKLLNLAQQYRETVTNADNLDSKCRGTRRKSPDAKAGYEKIEERNEIVGRARTTDNRLCLQDRRLLLP